MNRTSITFPFVLAFAALVGCGEKRTLGKTCARDSECASSTCLAVLEARVCTKECHADGECGAGLSCFNSGSEYGHCAPADVKAKGFGESCADSSECDHRVCVKQLMNRKSGYCSKICKEDSDCDDDAKCGKGVGGSSKFCQK